MKTRFLSLVLAVFACKDDKPVPEAQLPAAPHAHEETDSVTTGARLNRLAQEKSVYLKQHATNPVDWYPWGDEAFSKAKRENKPVFLSIGYSSCHWCHVMEHESFADQEVADLLNQHFVAIKVDREERPDVDAIYMNAAMAIMRGGGGWPLSVWLTPDRKPFHAGTYFPKRTDPRFGRIGFIELLTRIQEAWDDEAQRTQILAAGNQIAGYVQDMYDQEEPAALGADVLKGARASAENGYDATYGGFSNAQSGYAPKFPSPSTVELVLRAALRDDDKQALAMVTNTLDRMAKGGIHDHVGGGFHRYSTTRDWLVPHFEKMLYDNAQLLSLYAWAYLVTKDELYAATARDIAVWVQREMTNEQGGFFAAQDADDPGGPEHEGGFYVWDPHEMRDLFGEKDAAVLAEWFHISSKGNWFLPNGEQEKPGKSLLQIRRSAVDVAKQFEMSVEELEALVARAKAAMYEVREKRPKPITDPKALTAWNALMVSGFCKAYQALGDESMLVSARRAAEFLRKNLRRDGKVLRRWADGDAAFDGVLDDYAYSIAAALDLYETTFETMWLEDALALTETTIRLFHDEKDGAFFFTASDGEELIARGKSGTDNARPSANGVMAFNLLRISELTGDQERRAMAAKSLDYFGTHASVAVLGYGTILNALDFAQKGTREIFIAGDPRSAGTQALIQAVWHDPDPNRVLAVVTPGLEKLLPPAAGKEMVDGKPAAYVCRNFTCDAPVTDPAELQKAR